RDSRRCPEFARAASFWASSGNQPLNLKFSRFLAFYPKFTRHTRLFLRVPYRVDRCLPVACSMCVPDATGHAGNEAEGYGDCRAQNDSPSEIQDQVAQCQWGVG